MSREIKFRAWNAGEKEMVAVCDLTFLSDGALAGFRVQSGEVRTLNKPELMQYTGLKDKNGVEIYEGDICRFSIMGEGSVVRIVWLRSAWGFEPLFPEKVHPDDREARAFYMDPFEGDDWPADRYFEVIGNIHENPELLEEAP